MSAERPIALPDRRVFHSDPENLGGTLVFAGTRVPVRSLIEHLEAGYGLDEYLANFPTMRHDELAPHRRRSQAPAARLRLATTAAPVGERAPWHTAPCS